MTTHEFINNFKDTHKRLPSQVELTRNLKISPQLALQSLIEHTREVGLPSDKEAPIKQQKDLTVPILRGFLVLLSAMAFILSVYFTGLWFMGRFSVFIAGLISLSMVMFMVIAPQTLRFVDNQLTRAIVVLSFIIALVFSMGSTVAGQYNKTTELIETEPDRAYIFNKLGSSEDEILQLIEDTKKDKEVHQTSILLLSGSEEARKANWQSIATERKYIASFDQRIDALRIELKNVRNNQVENGIIKEKRDFYLFISSLTGMEKSFTEFLISALPAIFIDIISALCLNLALFIGRKR